MAGLKSSTTLAAGWTAANVADTIRDLFVAAGFTSNVRDTFNTRLTGTPSSAIDWERSRVRIVPEAGAHGDLGLTFYCGMNAGCLNVFCNVSSNNHGTFLFPEAALHSGTTTWGWSHWIIVGTTAWIPTNTAQLRVTLYRHNASPGMYYFLNITSYGDTTVKNDFQFGIVNMVSRARIFTELTLDRISPWVTLRHVSLASGSEFNQSLMIGGRLALGLSSNGRLGHSTTFGNSSISPVWAGLARLDTNASGQTVALGHNHIGPISEPDMFGRIMIRKNIAFRVAPGGAERIMPYNFCDTICDFGSLHSDLAIGPGIGVEGYRIVVQAGVEEYEQTHTRANPATSASAVGYGPQMFVRMV